MNRNAACQTNRGVISIIGRVKQDHFIERLHHCLNGNEQGLGCARGDGNIKLRVDRNVVVTANFFGDLIPQIRNTVHGWVLMIAALGQASLQRIEQAFWWLKVREPLRKVNRVMVARQLRHHAKNRRADVR